MRRYHSLNRDLFKRQLQDEEKKIVLKELITPAARENRRSAQLVSSRSSCVLCGDLSKYQKIKKKYMSKVSF
jgi:hypothetical protein